ncbi:Ikappab kinase complex-associated protein [Entamoeba marina]
MQHLQVHTCQQHSLPQQFLHYSNINSDEDVMYLATIDTLYTYTLSGKITKFPHTFNTIRSLYYNADSTTLLCLTSEGLYDIDLTTSTPTLKINNTTLTHVILSDDCNYILLASPTTLYTYTPDFLLLNTATLPSNPNDDSNTNNDITTVSISSDASFIVAQTPNALYIYSPQLNHRETISIQTTVLSIRPSGEFITAATNDSICLVEQYNNIYKTFKQTTPSITKTLQWDNSSTFLLEASKLPDNTFDLITVKTYRYGHFLTLFSHNFTDLRYCCWDNKVPLRLHAMTTDSHVVFDFSYHNESASCVHIHATSTDSLSLTDFRIGMIPPPLFHHKIPVVNPAGFIIQNISNSIYIVVVDADNSAHFFNYQKPSRKPQDAPKLISITPLPIFCPSTLYLISTNELLVVDALDGSIYFVNLSTKTHHKLNFPTKVISITQNSNFLYYLFADNTISRASIEEPTTIQNINVSLPQPVPQFFLVGDNPENTIFSMFEHVLYKNKDVIAQNVTSFITTPSYIYYTTLDHRLISYNIKNEQKWSRAVERGAMLVNYVTSDCSIIFQMPRGNLEIIHPREVILETVVGLLNNRRYKEVFSVVKRHKVNYNFVRDCASEQICEDVNNFVEMIEKADVLNAFLLSLEEIQWKEPYSFYVRDNTQQHERTSLIAIAIRNYLTQSNYPELFVTTYIATFLIFQPIDFAIILKELLHFNENARITGVMYLGTFFPTNALFKFALQTNSKTVAKLVLNHSTLDPKEYEEQINSLPDE